MVCNIKLSIIIPVYNVEAYIKACLDSVINQKGVSNYDYEVIVVNDGSPDRSIDIINEYDWNNCQYKIITQENKGLSGARNTGLLYANGEYIWFVDSDDVISDIAVKEIISVCGLCEIINIGYTEIHNGHEKKYYLPNYATDGKDLLLKGISVPAPFHVFKRTFLINNNLRFVEGILHEDMEFTPRCVYLAKKIVTIDKSLYYYQIRSGSIMTTIKPKRAFDYITVATLLINFSLNHGETLKSTPLLNTICMSINNALSIISRADKLEQNKWNTLFGQNSMLIKALCCSSVPKYKVEGCLFKLIRSNRIKIYSMLIKLKNI